MKNFLFAFVSIVLLSTFSPTRATAQPSELTASMLEIPQELFDVTKNLVVTTDHVSGFKAVNSYVKKSAAVIKAENDAYKIALRTARANKTALPAVPNQYEWKTTFTKSSSDKPFAFFALNFVHDLIWEFGYQYEGFANGKYTLHKYHGDFLASDRNIYPDYDSWFYIYQENNKWCIGGDNDMPKFVYEVPDLTNTYKNAAGQTITPNQLKQFTAQEIATSTGMTVDQVLAWEADYRICEVRNPTVYVTSLFPRFDEAGNYATYISGKRSDLISFSSLLYLTGTKWGDYDIQMIAINGCDIPEVKTSDTDWTGNGGQCFARWYETEADSKAFSYSYDYTKEFAVKLFAIELSAGNGSPNGHYDRFHAYYNLKNSKVMQSPSDKN